MPAEREATLPLPGLSPVGGKPIVARFDGGSLSSDGGLLTLREIEARLGVAQRLAACIDDPRAGADPAQPRRHAALPAADDRRRLRGRQQRGQPAAPFGVRAAIIRQATRCVS